MAVRFQGARFSVEQTQHHGHTFDVVIHPGAVVVLAFLDTQVLLIKNRRPAVGKTLLELPAGTLEPGEAPEQTARRELEEETGYRAKKLMPLCTFFSSPGYTNEKLTAYLAEDLTHVGQQLDPSEEITVATMTMQEALQAIQEGKIVDAKTMAVLLYYHTFVAKARH